jgi:hypothetical protein
MSVGHPERNGEPIVAVARFLAEVWAHAAPTSAEPRAQRRYAVVQCGQDWRVLTGNAQIGNLTAQALQDGHAAELYAQCELNDFSLRALFRST